jgi:hypothetical protein|tara:strand:+ start:1259 stop:1444 length:186 start_codon:yes stop_codon:yes gene_type:complete
MPSNFFEDFEESHASAMKAEEVSKHEPLQQANSFRQARFLAPVEKTEASKVRSMNSKGAFN